MSDKDPPSNERAPNECKSYLFEYIIGEMHLGVFDASMIEDGWLRVELVSSATVTGFCDPITGKDVSSKLYVRWLDLIELVQSGDAIPVPPFSTYDVVRIGDRIHSHYN